MTFFNNIEAPPDDKDKVNEILKPVASFVGPSIETIERYEQEREGRGQQLRELQEAERAKRDRFTLTKGDIERDIAVSGIQTTEQVAELAKLERRIAESYKETKRLEESRKLPPTLTTHKLFESINELDAGTKVKAAFVSVSPKKGEAPTDLVDRYQNSITALIRKRGQIRNASLKYEIALAHTIGGIKAKSAAGAVNFLPNTKLVQRTLNLHPSQGNTEYPTTYTDSGREVPDTFLLVHYLLEDVLIQRATEVLAKHYEGNPFAVPEADRASLMAAIDAEILAEARKEEAAIQLAEAAGIKVLRRPNAPPFAVLGIEVDDSPRQSDDAQESGDDFEFG